MLQSKVRTHETGVVVYIFYQVYFW